ASDDGLDAKANERVAAAVGIGASAIASAAGAKAVGWLKPLLGLSSVVFVGAVVALALKRPATPPNEVRPPNAMTQTAAPVMPAVTQQEVPTVSVNDLPLTPKPTRQAASPGGELAELERIRAELASGKATQALSDLDRYDATYRRGQFAEEAAVVRIEALAVL